MKTIYIDNLLFLAHEHLNNPIDPGKSIKTSDTVIYNPIILIHSSWIGKAKAKFIQIF